MKPRICVNCQYYLPTKDGNPKNSKCYLFPRKETTINFLVSGVMDKDRYYHCSVSREFDSLCGEEGKYYEEKVHPPLEKVEPNPYL